MAGSAWREEGTLAKTLFPFVIKSPVPVAWYKRYVGFYVGGLAGSSSQKRKKSMTIGNAKEWFVCIFLK
jgi:hypothetical protein